jgi:tRNA nucleotidyltransferase/poly(A) polymerase
MQQFLQSGQVKSKMTNTTAATLKLTIEIVNAQQVNEYLSSQGKETRTAAVIQSNPDQSKHLETARMKVQSIWIDLVNLRSETYADGSRIPKMEFGTPYQDAMRRCAPQTLQML